MALAVKQMIGTFLTFISESFSGNPKVAFPVSASIKIDCLPFEYPIKPTLLTFELALFKNRFSSILKFEAYSK